MVLRRRPRAPVPPPPELWQQRFDSALRLIGEHVSDPSILRRVSDLEVSLVTADADRRRLEATLAQLDTERATRELKAALRRNLESPSPANEALVDSLKRRHESIHALQDRIELLERSVDQTIADLEILAASTVELALRPGAGGGDRLGEHDAVIADLQRDLEVLEQVHRDLADR